MNTFLKTHRNLVSFSHWCSWDFITFRASIFALIFSYIFVFLRDFGGSAESFHWLHNILEILIVWFWAHKVQYGCSSNRLSRCWYSSETHYGFGPLNHSHIRPGTSNFRGSSFRHFHLQVLESSVRYRIVLHSIVTQVRGGIISEVYS